MSLLVIRMDVLSLLPSSLPHLRLVFVAHSLISQRWANHKHRASIIWLTTSPLSYVLMLHFTWIHIRCWSDLCGGLGMSDNSFSSLFENCGNGYYRFQVDGYVHYLIIRSPLIRYFKTMFVQAEELVWLGDKQNCYFEPSSPINGQEKFLIIEDTQDRTSN